MDPILVKFRNKLLIYTLIVLLSGLLVGYFSGEEFILKWSWTLVALFSITSWLIYFMLFKESRVHPKKFIPWFMGISGLKMFLFLAILISFVFFNKDAAIPFVITFFACYLLFSIFEVIHLLKMPMGDKNTSDENK